MNVKQLKDFFVEFRIWIQQRNAYYLVFAGGILLDSKSSDSPTILFFVIYISGALIALDLIKILPDNLEAVYIRLKEFAEWIKSLR